MVVCCGIWLDLFRCFLSCVFGCEGCGGCVVVVVGCWQQCGGRWLLEAVWWLLIVFDKL